jgi:thiol-disulfide isomerase/thioredoxin
MRVADREGAAILDSRCYTIHSYGGAPVRISILPITFLSLWGTCFAQPQLPGCEPRPEVQQELREHLNDKSLDKLKFAEQAARRHEVLEGLIARYPGELEPYRRLIDFVRDSETDHYPALQARYKEQAAQKPGDPLALYLAGYVLTGTDTPEAIRLLEAAKAKAPEFAWPALQLANIYSTGKFTDGKKSGAYLSSFFSVCGSSTESRAQWILAKGGDTALQARVAAALRERLAKESDPEILKQYATLWGLEFRSRSTQQHAALRRQVAEDLKRLESANSKPDGDWLAFLRGGYKQSGASEAALTAFDDRILKEFPSSDAAYHVAVARWDKAHKQPEDQQDTAAWTAWTQAYREALKSWIHDYPDNTFLSHAAWFYQISNDMSIAEKEGIAALDHYFKTALDYESPGSSPYLVAADFLVTHKWQPKRALDLLHKAQPMLAAELKQPQGDDLSPDRLDEIERSAVYQQQNLNGLILQAARLANRPAEAQGLHAEVEGAPPKSPKRQSDYWRNRARLAALENRKADALTYYELALKTRLSPPTPWHGRLDDPVSDEARALFKDLGGTDVAWGVWSKPPGTKPQEATEGRWEKPTRQLPTFELADLSGKTWKLATFEGKSVLINIWATWCGPCKTELPHLQKLYETVKDRPGLQILTFNIDEDLGLVEPFMKEKGYTFPVLPAFSFVTTLLDGFAIPQNWIVDPKGAWRWTQIGYGGEPDWIDVMIRRMEEVKKSE